MIDEHAFRTAVIEDGLTDPELADRFGVSSRTVLRWRQRLGLSSPWRDSLPAHGTITRYRPPYTCRCAECRRALAAARKRYVRSAQRRTPPGHAHGLPWTPEEDAVLMDSTLGTLVARARRLGRTYNAALNRLGDLKEAQTN